jgi:hypothetical protein
MTSNSSSITINSKTATIHFNFLFHYLAAPPFARLAGFFNLAFLATPQLPLAKYPSIKLPHLSLFRLVRNSTIRFFLIQLEDLRYQENHISKEGPFCFLQDIPFPLDPARDGGGVGR